MLTARVHPGESNSSFVMEGLLSCLTSDTSLSTQLKSKYIFYVIPMLNPDGVVAGNYRTSLFGKDLNRTYDQSRKYAFPETYELLQLAKRLK
jgi:murein tripeptide amidase MpaA